MRLAAVAVLAIGILLAVAIFVIGDRQDRRTKQLRQLRQENERLRLQLDEVQRLAVSHLESEPFALLVLDATRNLKGRS